MSKRKTKVNMPTFIIATMLIIFVLIIIAIYNMVLESREVKYKGNLNTEIDVDSGKDPNIAVNQKNSETERLEAMTERARIEYYVTKFMNYIEAENYDEAYKLLNSDYKKNYFSTQKSFEDYVKTNFSKMMDIDYSNFERTGDVYVIWMTVTDAINGGPNSGKEINFVVKENEYNDFELSFSAN